MNNNKNKLRKLIEEAGDLKKAKKSTIITLIDKILDESDKFTSESLTNKSSEEEEIKKLKDEYNEMKKISEISEKKYQRVIQEQKKLLEESDKEFMYYLIGFGIIEFITILFILL